MKVVDIARGAVEAGVSRERLIRLVQVGRVVGYRRDGRWFVNLPDVIRLRAELAAERGMVTAGQAATAGEGA